MDFPSSSPTTEALVPIPLRLRRPLIAVVTGLLAAAGAVITVPSPAHAIGPGFDHAFYWNNVLLRAFRNSVGPAGGPTTLTRAGAMMHLAMWDAYLSLGGSGTPYLGRYAKIPNFNYDTNQNVNQAAYQVLEAVFPTMDFLSDLSAANKAEPPLGEPGPEGFSTSVGQAAAQGIINNRANDGSTNNTPYTPSTAPGQWRPTDSRPALSPNWGLVRPFAATSGTQFRPPGPAGQTSVSALLPLSAYAAQVNEVKALGRKTGSTRTADQTQAAHFWANDADGTYKAPGQLFQHTQIVMKQLNRHQDYRLFALMAMALADAAITVWNSKYQTSIDLWRPITAITLADTDNNAATTKDAAWLPLGGTPPFPAYTSGHAGLAGAWSGLLRRYLGTDSVRFTGPTEDPNAVGVTRTFSTLTAAAVENGRSRIYLGVHYQWDADFGRSTGDAVANHVFTTRLR
jgi:PAP2 superfamily protein